MYFTLATLLVPCLNYYKRSHAECCLNSWSREALFKIQIIAEWCLFVPDQHSAYKKKGCTFLKGSKCGQIFAFGTKGEVIHSLSSALQAINLSGISISFNHRGCLFGAISKRIKVPLALISCHQSIH